MIPVYLWLTNNFDSQTKTDIPCVDSKQFLDNLSVISVISTLATCDPYNIGVTGTL